MAHYRGTKSTYNDIDFDSIDEKNYYIELKEDNRMESLQVHPKFILLEGFKNYEGKSLRSITFKPDYMYFRDGVKYIEDCKPLNKKLIDADFMIRWKLLQHMYKDENIKFRLVAYDKKAKEFIEI